MNKVKCRCGIKGIPGSKCIGCSSIIKEQVKVDPDPALYVPEEAPIEEDVYYYTEEDEEDGRE